MSQKEHFTGTSVNLISGEIISFKYLNYFEGGGRESFPIMRTHACFLPCARESRTRREVKVFKNERQTMENIQKNQLGMGLFLSAYIHQGDDLFSAQSRGKQCAFMSLSAILTAENMPLIDWSKTTFNNVLILQGDKMYLRALNNGLIVLEPSIEFLSVDNLPKVVGVSCCRNMFSYEIDRLMSQTSSAQKVTLICPLWWKVTLIYPLW